MAAEKNPFAQCSNRLPGHGAPESVAESLRRIADGLDAAPPMTADVYGEGEQLAAFEADVAEMFGKGAAVFMPSGTMAQQIALRIHCEASGKFTVAMHPTSHLETAEHLGYQHLHGIHRLGFGVPETLGGRLLVAKDLAQLGVIPGVALIEVPCRPLGGRLYSWDELTALSAWAREHHVPLHLDGARIWQCADALVKTLAEIGELFDSIYVSFYKDLGGLCGCMLLGTAAFVAESRVWLRRHGGNLFTQAPFVASAQQGMQQCLPQMPAWNARARLLAGELTKIDGVIVNPNPPQVNFFQVFLKGESEALMARHHALAATSGTFIFHRLAPAPMPGYSMAEIHCWENAATFDVAQLAPFMTRMLDNTPL